MVRWEGPPALSSCDGEVLSHVFIMFPGVQLALSQFVGVSARVNTVPIISSSVPVSVGFQVCRVGAVMGIWQGERHWLGKSFD